MGKISVFLVDWQVLFREGIHFILSGEEDMEVIGEETENTPALAAIEANPPQVAILNADHDKLSGVDATQRIKQNHPEVAIILIMDSDNEEQLFAAMKSGASACLTKDINPEDMVKTIRQVVQGKQPIAEALLRPELASRVAHEFEILSSIGEQVGDLFAHLTQPETEILHYIVEGKPKEEMAKTLGTSEEASHQKLESIRQKLVTNFQKQRLIQAAQSGFPPISRISFGRPEEYVTREEFNAFKESLKERFKSLSGEIG